MLLLTLNKSKNLVVKVSILLAFKTSLGETGCLGNPYLLLYWLPKHPGFDSSPNIVRPPLVSYSSLYSTFVTSWCHATPLVTSYFPPNHLPQMLWIWKSVFYSQAFFYLALFTAFSRLPWGQQFNLTVSRASCWSSKHSPGPTICLNHSNQKKIYMR